MLILGYAYVDKIFLDYDRPFWVWSEGTINLAWSADELQKRTDWTRGISKISEVPSSKHVLEVKVSGPEAAVMEHVSDEDVAKGSNSSHNFYKTVQLIISLLPQT